MGTAAVRSGGIEYSVVGRGAVSEGPPIARPNFVERSGLGEHSLEGDFIFDAVLVKIDDVRSEFVTRFVICNILLQADFIKDPLAYDDFFVLHRRMYFGYFFRAHNRAVQRN